MSSQTPFEMMQPGSAISIPAAFGSSSVLPASRHQVRWNGKAPALYLLALIAALLTGCSSGGGAFSSNNYGYAATLPAGWSGHQAEFKWSGLGSPGFEDSDVDTFSGPNGILVMAYGTASRESLRAYTTATVHAAAAEHQCPADLPSQAITVDGAPAQLVATQCQGLSIETAVTMHAANAIVFVSQIPSGTQAGRAHFRRFLTSIRFQK